ncbi:MAG: helix-turn-helix domain-containing protein [Limnochordaceae bacterium]|nr:helix-turn-helix domain-containing protein [Limnochordaceae bacterium]
MSLTPAGLLFVLAGIGLLLRGSRALFAGLLFGAAFPSTAVFLVERFNYGVQPYQWFTALYVVRVARDWARSRGVGQEAPAGQEDRRWLFAVAVAWVGTVTLGWALGMGPASRAVAVGRGGRRRVGWHPAHDALPGVGCTAVFQRQSYAIQTIDARQAASLLGVHYVTLLKWAKQGRVPCVHLGSRVRFRVSALQQWLEEQERRGATGKAA